MISIRRIALGEADIFKHLRLASLSESPQFFGTTLENAQARTEQSWHQQADCSAGGSDRATFLAFSDDDPIAIAALYRDGLAHDYAALIQVWVRPAYRRRGIAGMLLGEKYSWAKANDYTQIYTWVVKDNKKMLRVLSKFCFEFTGDEESFRDAIVSCQLIKSVK